MRGKFCENCGTLLEDTARFCPECGTKRAEAQPAAPVAPAPEVSWKSSVMPGNDDMMGGAAWSAVGAEYDDGVEFAPAPKGRMTEAEIQALLTQMMEYLVPDKFQQGLEKLVSYRARADHNIEYMCMLGRFYRITGNRDKSMEAYQEARKLDPEFAVVYANLATLYIDMKQYKEAEKMCVYSIQRFQKNPSRYRKEDYASTYSIYARSLAWQKRFTDAERLLREAEKHGYPYGKEFRRAFGMG